MSSTRVQHEPAKNNTKTASEEYKNLESNFKYETNIMQYFTTKNLPT